MFFLQLSPFKFYLYLNCEVNSWDLEVKVIKISLNAKRRVKCLNKE